MFLRKTLVIIVMALTIGLVMIGTAEARQPLRVGVFLPERSRAAISDHEAQVGRHQDIIMYYEAWGSGGGNIDAERVQWIIDNGSIPMITWEPWKWGGPVTDQPDYSLKKMSSGAHDAYLRSYARDIKEINGIVYLRPMHEMNGDWYPWSGTVNGNSPADFIPAWRRIVNIFRQEGAYNVRWVWTPNNSGLPDWGTSSFSTYYPGDNYVDFAGIDGYNFGAMESWSQWELFPDVFKAAYKAIAKITDKPIIIGETASTEAGGNKADWITNAFSEMTSNYPRINAIIWFNEDKESDWRIDSSSASLAAYKAALAKLGENGDDIALPLEVPTEPKARLLDFKKSKKPKKSAKKRTRPAGKILPMDNKKIVGVLEQNIFKGRTKFEQQIRGSLWLHYINPGPVWTTNYRRGTANTIGE